MRLPLLFSGFRSKAKSKKNGGTGCLNVLGSPSKGDAKAEGPCAESPDEEESGGPVKGSPPCHGSPLPSPGSRPGSPRRRSRTFSEISTFSVFSVRSGESLCVSDGVVELTDARLQHFLNEVEQSVQPLVQASFATVRTLQQANRNSGSVQLAEWSAEGGGFVAVKRMPRRWVCSSPSEFQDMHEASAEKPWVDLAVVRYLHSIGYPYVCQPLGIFIDGESMHVVSSLATEGDLCTWCDSSDPAPGEAREVKMVPLAAQMFQAVRWLHELGIAHRDLSLENITLTKSVSGDHAVKLIDFGMSSTAKSARNQLRGKASYQAPEIHTTHKYCTFMADTFSLGVVLFTLAAQDYPWKSTRRNTCQQFELARMMGLKKFLEKKMLHEGGQPLSEVFSPGLVGLLEGVLERSPARRLTLGETGLHKKPPQRTSVWGCAWLADVQHMACGCPANIAEATARR